MKEAQIYKLLDKYGIKTPKYKVFKIDEKLEFDIFPCVLKVHSNNIVHKSDVGGVVLDIMDNKQLNIQKQKLLQNIPLDKDDEFIVEEQIKGIEFFIGGIDDAIFGEVLVFGEGGVFLEIKKDITYIDTNSTKKEILKAIKKTKISKIFPQFRGKKYDIDEVINTIEKFQKLFVKEDIKEFDINPIIYTNKGLVAVDARIKPNKQKHKKHFNKKYSLFENKNIAIIGASENPQKVGYAIAKNSLSSKSNIFFVNPKLSTLFDKKVYKLEEIENIDTAVIAIPSKFVISTIKYLINKGTKNFIVISAGFKESGNYQDEEKLKKLAHKYNVNIIGPNCLGIYNSTQNLNLTFAKSKIYKGKLGLISQSGAVLTALMDKASDKKIGFSHIISMGNMADFDFSNSIKELNNQKECEVIAIYAEGISFGKSFLKEIRKSKKPILFFKAGKTNQAKKAAFSHTGNIAGNYEMIINLVENSGAKIVSSIESLIFYKDIKDVLIVTNAGGPGTILTDLVALKNKNLVSLDTKTINKLNEVLPQTWSKNNPIDVIGDATPKRYKDTLEIIKNKADIIFVIVTPQFMTDEEEIAKILKSYKNVIPIFLESYSDKISNILKNKFYFTSLEEAVKIL